MEKADFLDYVKTVVEVRQLRDQMDALCDPKCPKYSADPRSPGSPGSAAMVGVVSEHMELAALYEAALAEKEAQQLAVERAIQSLDVTGERLVMRARYIEGKDWPVVIRELTKLGYSERTLYRLHGSALWRLKDYK